MRRLVLITLVLVVGLPRFALAQTARAVSLDGEPHTRRPVHARPRRRGLRRVAAARRSPSSTIPGRDRDAARRAAERVAQSIQIINGRRSDFKARDVGVALARRDQQGRPLRVPPTHRRAGQQEGDRAGAATSRSTAVPTTDDMKLELDAARPPGVRRRDRTDAR